MWLSVDFVDSFCGLGVSCEFNLGVTVDSWTGGGNIAETCVGEFWFGSGASCEFNLGVTVDLWSGGGNGVETCVGEYCCGFGACVDSLGGGLLHESPPPSSPPTGTMANIRTC